MKVSIIGAGAIGCFLASRLDVLNINYEMLFKESNLSVSNPSFTIDGAIKYHVNNINYITDYRKISGDIIFITTKSFSNVEVFSKLRGLKNKTIILFQNGIGEEDKLAKLICPSNDIVAATSNIKVTKNNDTVTLFTDLYNLTYAYLDQPKNKLRIDLLFEKIFSSLSLCKTVYEARFKKLVINTSCSGLSVITGADMYTMATNNKFSKHIIKIAEEVVDVAKSYDVILDKSFINNILQILSNPDYKGSFFSMKQDFEQKKPLEIESIYTNFINLADNAAVSVPHTVKLYNKLLDLNNY
ncbi:ketopantoate reductase C-terminal domain-containing protein [Francisella sp. 19X1-34]|uniref:ketopantoate reductase family protein n=1 Tax=Francisella sp. 19X1-34 TaxID=3087177 RepID=UPI002E350D4A|nr:ketopantoate reductase C-terminal domain-containing protein [Francisella sp. 19X1-34]MED7789601.1 ketopantoate reductase C-terminal domain-containing protein [Francisella sp. 19X1-34]